MEQIFNIISVILGGIFCILIMFGCFIFPILYLVFDITWLNTICIIYAILYALSVIKGGNLIPYIIIFVINLIFLKIQGNPNYLLLSFIEVPLMVGLYCLFNGYYKRNRNIENNT